ncbi:hypothetical protein LWX53_00795 [bacterium]|nr:hypothetical protein [bacterium]
MYEMKFATRWRKMRAASASAAAIAAICLAVASCSSDLSTWYPSGTASIAACREFAERGQSGCAFTVKVANDGESIIGAYTVSISASTSSRTYFATFGDDLVILPGRHAYFDGSIRFADEGETLLPEGLAIVCDYYR